MNRTKFSKRSGTVAIMVLVCLVVTTTIVLGAVTSSLRQRRQLQREIQLEQTRLLLDAGIAKAIAEFENDPAYAGETFDKIDEIGNYKNAFLEIKKLESERVQFQITAKLAPSAEARQTRLVQRSKTITLQKD